jgi:F-type H+-transporting ATPase subunit b
LEKLGINGGLLLGQLLNFAVVALILWALMWKPIVNALEARRKRIAEGLEDARAAEQALANAERDVQKIIEQRRAEANKLVEEARLRGEEQTRGILEEAQHEALAIRAKARDEATEERNAMLGDVRTQIAQIAIAAAERVVGQSLDETKAQAIVNDFFTSLPAGVSDLGANIVVTSALPLTDAEKAQIKAQTGAQNIAYKVDPSILGGLVLQSGEKVVDGSVRNSLSNLAMKMN